MLFFLKTLAKDLKGFPPAKMRYYMCIVARDFINLGMARCIKHFLTPINCVGIKTAIFPFNYFVFDVLPGLWGALQEVGI